MREEDVRFQDILNFKRKHDIKGWSLMEVLVSFCEEYDLDPDEVGTALKKDKAFRETFKQDLMFNNEASFNGEPAPKVLEWV